MDLHERVNHMPAVKMAAAIRSGALLSIDIKAEYVFSNRHCLRCWPERLNVIILLLYRLLAASQYWFPIIY